MHYWADLESVHGFRCYDNSAEREMPASACTRSMPSYLTLFVIRHVRSTVFGVI